MQQHNGNKQTNLDIHFENFKQMHDIYLVNEVKNSNITTLSHEKLIS